MDSTSTRRPCFIEGDDGLAYLADNKQAGFSGKHYLSSRPICHSSSSSSSSSLRRNNTLRNLSFSSVYASSPRSATARFYDGARYEQQHQPHFLDSCFLCNTPLGDNRDIFMYRGDTPFCSEECRQEQIEMDEANEKNWNLSSSMKSMRKKEHKKSNPPNKGYPFHTGAVAA